MGKSLQAIVAKGLYAATGNDLVILKNAPFKSRCKHDKSPFKGKCTIAYLPGAKIIGLGKLPKIVNYFASKPQLQETLTAEVAKAIEKILLPKGVAVVMKAKHKCLKHAKNAVVITATYLGAFKHSAKKKEFLKLLG